MNTLKTALLSTALIAAMVAPAMAAEKKMTKEIKELVGYDVTVSQSYDALKLKAFNKIDRDADSYLTARELKNGSNIENSYALFLGMDTNKDKRISIEEYSTYDKTKGNTQVESELHGKAAVKGSNLKSRRVIETKTYFEPTEREVVEIKDISETAE